MKRGRNFAPEFETDIIFRQYISWTSNYSDSYRCKPALVQSALHIWQSQSIIHDTTRGVCADYPMNLATTYSDSLSFQPGLYCQLSQILPYMLASNASISQ